MYIVFLILSLLVGMMVSIQGVINSIGASIISLPMMLALFSIVQAIPALIFILIKRPSLGIMNSIARGWKWFLISGLIGATLVTIITLTISEIGALTAFVLIVLGQIISSAIADHIGFLGIEAKPITFMKIISILIIFVGVSLLVISDSVSSAALFL